MVVYVRFYFFIDLKLIVELILTYLVCFRRIDFVSRLIDSNLKICNF